MCSCHDGESMPFWGAELTYGPSDPDRPAASATLEPLWNRL